MGIDEALYKACEDNRKLEVEIEEKDKEIERLNNIIEHIENICKSSIASVDKILLDEKEIKVKDGIVQNRNNYQIVRLKAYRTKSKEILGRIKELKGSNGAIPPEVIGTNGEDGGLFDYGDR